MGKQGTGGTGRSAAPFPLGKPQPGAQGPSRALAALVGPLKLVSTSVSRAVWHPHGRWGQATTQPGIMPLLPRRAFSMAHALLQTVSRALIISLLLLNFHIASVWVFDSCC